jgi:hypothetical protein
LAQKLAEDMLLRPPDLFAASSASGATTPKCKHQIDFDIDFFLGTRKSFNKDKNALYNILPL